MYTFFLTTQCWSVFSLLETILEALNVTFLNNIAILSFYLFKVKNNVFSKEVPFRDTSVFQKKKILGKVQFFGTIFAQTFAIVQTVSDCPCVNVCMHFYIQTSISSDDFTFFCHFFFGFWFARVSLYFVMPHKNHCMKHIISTVTVF